MEENRQDYARTCSESGRGVGAEAMTILHLIKELIQSTRTWKGYAKTDWEAKVSLASSHASQLECWEVRPPLSPGAGLVHPHSYKARVA